MTPSGHGRRFHAARTNVSAHLAVELVALLPLLAGERVALRVAPQAAVERLGDNKEISFKVES